MTDPRTPPPDDRAPVDPDVALASAHVDGELDDAGQARLAADPGAAALAVRLAAIAHEVRDVPPPPPELVDAHVAAALAAMDEPAPHAAEGAVVPISRARSAVPWWQRVPLGAVAAVVAVVALVGAIGLASQAGDDDTDTAATALDDAAEGEDGADAEEDSGALEAAPFDTGGEGGGEAALRPAYGGYEELADSLAATPTTTASVTADEEADRSADDDAGGDTPAEDSATGGTVSPPLDPCGAVDILGLADADVEQVLPALVAGEAVTAVVHVVEGERRLSVVDDATCAVSFEQTL